MVQIQQTGKESITSYQSITTYLPQRLRGSAEGACLPHFFEQCLTKLYTINERQKENNKKSKRAQCNKVVHQWKLSASDVVGRQPCTYSHRFKRNRKNEVNEVEVGL
jgi:hypothetical protein